MYITRARTLRFPQFNMHPISSAQKENIISLASNGLPTRQIASKLGVGKSTVSRVLQDLLPNQQTPSSGRPARLSHCPAWRNLELVMMSAFFSRTMTPNTPPKRPKTGWKRTISLFWTGLHSPQTSIPLNTCGNTPNHSCASMRH
jgi:hypothetical protein